MKVPGILKAKCYQRLSATKNNLNILWDKLIIWTKKKKKRLVALHRGYT